MRLLAVLLLIATGLTVAVQAQPSSTQVYVPLVRVPGPTETPTGPTAIATATATTIPVLALTNGDFELGNTGWTLDGAFISQSTLLARGGTWYAQLGGDRTDQERLSQRVTITSASPILSFWHRASSDWLSCDLTVGYVWVDPLPDDATFSKVIVKSLRDFCQSRQHGYEQLTIDLSAYSGQTVELEFELDIFGGLYSFWLIDDVRFPGASTPAPTATSTLVGTPGNTATATTTATASSTPTVTPTTGTNCAAEYPTVCIRPPPPDLNCPDISFRNFTVLEPDRHNFDTDNDGVGCESG